MTNLVYYIMGKIDFINAEKAIKAGMKIVEIKSYKHPTKGHQVIELVFDN